MVRTKPKMNFYSGTALTNIAKWDKDFRITIAENIDFKQSAQNPVLNGERNALFQSLESSPIDGAAFMV